MTEARAPVRLACVYRRSWQDGFGARGWKLADAVADPEIIASTAATGERIPTSVFVHDILDHALCGLGTSGHRNEAVALLQLAERTGADPTPDIAQMVDEDLMQGRAVGEPLRSFLPPDLAALVPAGTHDDRDVIATLAAQLGAPALRQRLIARFFELGETRAAAARGCYRNHGLDHARRGASGLALQGLLAWADALAQRRGWASATATISITERSCGFAIDTPEPCARQAAY